MLVLGLDLGTTKSAAVLIDTETERQTARCSVKNNAGTGSQSVQSILDSAVYAVRGLPEEDRRKVHRIGITGQMHGVVCWEGKRVSAFENWQSMLALHTGTLDRIQKLKGCENLAPGYGFATLAVPGFRDGYAHAGTIMDYFTVLLTAADMPVTESSNAASWGLWDIRKCDWDRQAIARLGIPENILPQLKQSPGTVGFLCHEWANVLGLPEGIPVSLPIGDNPAAILGSGGALGKDIFITVGTGAQLAFFPSAGEETLLTDCELRPFPGGKILAVRAPFCGGKAIEVLAGFVADIFETFSVPYTMSDIYKKIGEDAGGLQPQEPLLAITHFMGERSTPHLRGSLDGIGLKNLSFREVCRAWFDGILDSLLNGIPPEVLQSRRRIVLNGNAVRNAPLFRNLLRTRLPELEMVLPEIAEEAASGAAFFCFNLAEK